MNHALGICVVVEKVAMVGASVSENLRPLYFRGPRGFESEAKRPKTAVFQNKKCLGADRFAWFAPTSLSPVKKPKCETCEILICMWAPECIPRKCITENNSYAGLAD